MEIQILIEYKLLLEKIKNNNIDEFIDIMYQLDNMDCEYIFFSVGDELQEVYKILYTEKSNQNIKILSRMFDKIGRKISNNNNLYEKCKKDIDALCVKESNNIKMILKNNKEFAFDKHIVKWGDEESYLRTVSKREDLCKILSIFISQEDDLNKFVDYIKCIYYNLDFDDDIYNSMQQLEAGFDVRRNEIIYHLLCLNTEIPRIISENGSMNNEMIGEKLSINCTPERNREIVKNQLTKSVDDNKKLVCELHTKLKKIGSRIPDRIYFCADVPNGIFINGIDMSHKIFIYKITKHAGKK